MEFRQLEAYIKVVELGSFSKAAKELHVSQPSVSTYISTLE
ncbi:MAG: LysR family transcriptional regulator, partial [Coriobacteriia bacterium]|nr:LysR family transcriptional regulator [Coriobacteriia bacterium]